MPQIFRLSIFLLFQTHIICIVTVYLIVFASLLKHCGRNGFEHDLNLRIKLDTILIWLQTRARVIKFLNRGYFLLKKDKLLKEDKVLSFCLKKMLSLKK